MDTTPPRPPPSSPHLQDDVQADLQPDLQADLLRQLEALRAQAEAEALMEEAIYDEDSLESMLGPDDLEAIPQAVQVQRKTCVRAAPTMQEK